MSELLDKKLEPAKQKMHSTFSSLKGLCIRIGHDGLTRTTEDLQKAVDDPFMFVIVGEVKAGKSSFINALLDTGQEICKVAASPMTDSIQQIVYGESESEQMTGQHVKRISRPIEILKDIAIVDTPGTNTIIEHHQAITESFIPSSDLIVFVFEAKNPYRQSSWDFFDYIHAEWHRKIIFVLQQKDLLNEADLDTNMDGVRNFAIQKGIMEPKVFAVSALQEIQGQKQLSGFQELREYINNNITGGQAAFIKLINLCDTALQLSGKIESGIDDRKRQLEYDTQFRQDIKNSLEQQEQKSKRYTRLLVENLVAAYEKIMEEKKDELKDNIGFFSLLRRSIGSIFSSESDIKTWLENFSEETEKRLNKEFSQRLDEGIGDISESIQDMALTVDKKLRDSKTILKDNHEIFSDIAEKRIQVMNDLSRTFKRFLESSESFYTKDLRSQSGAILPDIAKGSGLAIVGLIITSITNTAVFDITGGVITAIGLGFAGITLGINKSRILGSFQKTVDEGRSRIEDKLNTDLSSYAHTIRLKIEDNFHAYDLHLASEEEEIIKLADETKKISSALDSIRYDLQSGL